MMAKPPYLLKTFELIPDKVLIIFAIELLHNVILKL